MSQQLDTHECNWRDNYQDALEAWTNEITNRQKAEALAEERGATLEAVRGIVSAVASGLERTQMYKEEAVSKPNIDAFAVVRMSSRAAALEQILGDLREALTPTKRLPEETRE